MKHKVEIEYTAPNTPQQNGTCEKRIADDGRSSRAMLTSARLKPTFSNRLRAEAKSTATKIHNLWVTKKGVKCGYEAFYSKSSKLRPEHLIEWGRMGYVTDRTMIKGKAKPKAEPMLMVGYADNHSSDMYRLYNPATGQVVLSRDVTWANWMPTKTTEMLQELLLEDPDFDVRPGIEAVPTNPLVEEEPETGGYTPPVETLQDTVAGRTTSQDFDETTRRFNSQVTWKNRVI